MRTKGYLPFDSPKQRAVWIQAVSVVANKQANAFMMNFNFPVDSETTENGMSSDQRESRREVASEGDGGEDHLSSALDRLTEHFVKRINRLKFT